MWCQYYNNNNNNGNDQAPLFRRPFIGRFWATVYIQYYALILFALVVFFSLLLARTKCKVVTLTLFCFAWLSLLAKDKKLIMTRLIMHHLSVVGCLLFAVCYLVFVARCLLATTRVSLLLARNKITTNFLVQRWRRTHTHTTKINQKPIVTFRMGSLSPLKKHTHTHVNIRPI